MGIYDVKPAAFGIDVACKVPGSKSITNRAFLLAALARGTSRISGIGLSNDARRFLDCLESLGYRIRLQEEQGIVEIEGNEGAVPNKQGEVYVGSAGTAARFLTAMLAFADGSYRLRSSKQMERRPMKDLLLALEELGARFAYGGVPHCFPFYVEGMGDGWKQSEIAINIDKSSQFLSALLMACVLRGGGLSIALSGSRKALSYVGITTRMMEEFGCPVGQATQDGRGVRYEVARGSRYRAREYEVEPDVSAACYFYAMGAALGGTATVRGVHRDSMQGDVRFLDVLERMGCTLRKGSGGVCLTGPKEGRIKGVDVDMGDCSDQSMTLAAIAPFADSPTTIRGIGHVRGQESDRIRAMCTELGRMGIRNEEGEDWLRIYPGKPKPTTILTYDDHRMAMAFTITGLRTPGLRIADPECCVKTFPDYFTTLEKSLKGGLA